MRASSTLLYGALIGRLEPTLAYLVSPVAVVRRPFDSSTLLSSQRWNQDLDEAGRRKAQGGMGETAAGAVLGGLLLGPFGALFGASIGSNLGARNAVDRARKEEMDRLGLSQDMLDLAQDVGMSLQNSNEGLQLVQASLDTQQMYAKRLDSDVADLYQRANEALMNSNEELAKKLLLERTNVQEKLKQVLLQCAEERGRLKTMQDNVAQLERRALEIETMLRRTVSAQTRSNLNDSVDVGLSLRREDPLLKKFRDLGID